MYGATPDFSTRDNIREHSSYVRHCGCPLGYLFECGGSYDAALTARRSRVGVSIDNRARTILHSACARARLAAIRAAIFSATVARGLRRFQVTFFIAPRLAWRCGLV